MNLQREVGVRRYKLLFEEIGVNRCAGSATRYYENLLGIGHYFISSAEELLKHYRTITVYILFLTVLAYKNPV